MENNKSTNYLVYVLIGVAFFVVGCFAGKSLFNNNKPVEPPVNQNTVENNNENTVNDTNSNLDFSYITSFNANGKRTELVTLKDNKIYLTAGDYANNTLIPTKESNIVSVAYNYNCGDMLGIIYLTESNKLYFLNTRQIGIPEKGSDILLADDAVGFTLVDWNDPNDTCGGQYIVYKDTTGKVFSVSLDENDKVIKNDFTQN